MPSPVKTIIIMNTSKSSRAMRLALHLRRNLPDLDKSAALKSAWFLIHFRDALHHGMFYFTYRKSDGSVRRARGTLSQHLIPLCDVPKDSSPASDKKRSVSTFTYYDIDRKAWREFDIRRFVGYVERYPVLKEK